MNVLVATDGSRGARAAMDWLASSLPAAGASVTVVSAARMPHPAAAIEAAGRIHAAVTSEAGRVAEEGRKTLAGRWPDARARVVEGDPREEIVHLAETEQADLLVMGARGLGAVRRAFLGTVSVAVARHAPCAVLVVKDRQAGPGTVVAAVDGSAHAMRAVRFLASLGLEHVDRACVVGVVEPVRWPPRSPVALNVQIREAEREFRERRHAEMQAALEQAAAELRASIREVETIVEDGRPAGRIVEIARARGAGLVVVGARGLGAVKRLVLGTVSEAVLNDARCPVLVVKEERG
ncbi:MAG: universal stress protein [Candidatus Rokubacteria bacterium]|nr:universal stress protein [Candidatus Rokubacteria bacterium]